MDMGRYRSWIGLFRSWRLGSRVGYVTGEAVITRAVTGLRLGKSTYRSIRLKDKSIHLNIYLEGRNFYSIVGLAIMKTNSSVTRKILLSICLSITLRLYNFYKSINYPFFYSHIFLLSTCSFSFPVSFFHRHLHRQADLFYSRVKCC